MPTDNTGVQTRVMAQRTDSEPQETQNQNVNPTVELYKSKDESIKDFVRKHGTIALDWYVPNFSNTRVGDLIEQRLPIETADGRLVFSCPTLSEFFRASNFELDLKTGQVFTYLSPPENIGISCQKDPFDLEFLCNMLREEQDISMVQEESLERIPNIRDKILERIDEIATAMIQAASQSEENLAREQDQARARDKQLRSVRQTDRSGLNFFAQANSTPVRNDNPRTDNQGVHFKTNHTRHVYSTTSDVNDPYEPPENDSIIQTVSPLQTDQPTTSTTKPINCNTAWRHNNNVGTTVGTHRTTSVTATDNRSGPICFRCGERGHLRFNCTERVFGDSCKTFNHSS